MADIPTARWSPWLVPVVAAVLIALGTSGSVPVGLAIVDGTVLIAAVMLAVGRAEAIAHRVGEPYGTIVLAIAVTVIEAGLIVTLMATQPGKTAALARDTVFAAVMIAANGIVGISLLIATAKRGTVRFRSEGARALLGSIVVLTTLALVLPSFTRSSRGPTFTPAQIAFAAVAAIAVYGVFLFVQTTRHRGWFVDDQPDPPAAGHDGHASTGLVPDVVLLVLMLVAVVGLAKTLAPSIEDAVRSLGAPASAVGVVIAMLVLLPESIAASRAARRQDMQTSLNLALGSGLASIGLTIPVVAVATIWLPGPIQLGLDGKEMVLFALTVVVSALTYASAKGTVLHAAHHLTVFAAFLFLAFVP